MKKEAKRRKEEKKILNSLRHPPRPLRHINMVVRPQMFLEVIPPGKAIASLARTSLHGTVLGHGVVDASLVASQVRRASKCSATVFAAEGFNRPISESLEPSPNRRFINQGTYLVTSKGAS